MAIIFPYVVALAYFSRLIFPQVPNVTTKLHCCLLQNIYFILSFTWMSLLTLFKLVHHVVLWNLWWHLPFCLKSTSCLSSLLYLHQRALCFLGSLRSSILKKLISGRHLKLEGERKSKVKVFSPPPQPPPLFLVP